MTPSSVVHAQKVAYIVSARLSVALTHSSDPKRHRPFPGIHSTKCKEENKVASKLGALLILRGLLSLEIDPEIIPERVDEETGFDTIVEADYVRAVDGVEVEC